MLTVLGLGLLAVAFVLIKFLVNNRKLRNFPPGPPRLPLLGTVLSMPGELIYLYAERHWRHKYGPLVGLSTGSRPLLLVCGAEENLALFNHEHCQARPAGTSFKERSFGKRLGLMFTEGHYWSAHRRFTLRELRELGLGRSKLEGVVLDEVDSVVNAMRRDGPAIRPNGLFNGPVLNVLWYMVSGKPFSHGAGKAQDPKSLRLLDIMSRVMRNKRFFVAPIDIWPFLKHIAPGWSGYNDNYLPLFEMQDYLREEVKLRRQGADTGSFIEKYTEEMGKAEHADIFSDESLIITCLDLFLAGGESTANTLSFCILYMALYPEAQAKVHAELDAVCGDRAVTMADKVKLPCVEATLNEVMRINTIAPVAIPHINTEHIQINGYDIPKDTLLLLSVWSVLNDKKHWGDPENFRPERFIGADGKFVKDPWMIPFGAGKRTCLGEGLAMQVAFIFFANLMNRFSYSLPHGAEKPSTIPVSGFTTAPQDYGVLASPRPQ